MSITKTCMCGNKINIDSELVVCKVCSTKYNASGEMLISRHNWNAKEYFCSFEKSQLNLSLKRPS